MIKVYGIPTCDTIKKTLLWFKQNDINVDFHDYKKLGLPKEKLTGWCKQENWKALLNKKSTTWRNLTIETQENIKTPKDAILVMLRNKSIIKRPVIEYDEKILIGFDEKLYQQKFKK